MGTGAGYTHWECRSRDDILFSVLQQSANISVKSIDDVGFVWAIDRLLAVSGNQGATARNQDTLSTDGVK